MVKKEKDLGLGASFEAMLRKKKKKKKRPKFFRSVNQLLNNSNKRGGRAGGWKEVERHSDPIDDGRVIFN